MEKTLVLIKPSAVKRGHVGEIITIYEKNDLTIEEAFLCKASRKILNLHYAAHVENDYFEEIVGYMSDKVMVLILSGEDAIRKVRSINGDKDPKKANAGCIRKLFGENLTSNAVHASEDKKNAKYEIALWMKQKEISMLGE